MTHQELVQTATDLLSETKETARWLPVYDAALTATTDDPLNQFVAELLLETLHGRQMAA